MARIKQSTVFGQHSYGVWGLIRRRAQGKTLLCFRLRLVFPLHLAVAGLDERKKHNRGRGLPYHISYGDLFAGLADVAVWFKASHAQCDASAHNDSVAGNIALIKSSRAWIRPAIAAVSIKPSTRSATPFNWGLSAVVSS